MLNIQLINLSKKFNQSKIFSNLSYSFSSDNSYVIKGSNGSGKSTLLNILCGNTTPTFGTITFSINDKTIANEDIYKHASIVAPYLDLHDDLTLTETINFHSKFKQFYNNYSTSDIIQKLRLEKSAKKQLKDFSSGMKQRVKLALAILSNTPFLFLDEPTMNLDAENIQWYQDLIENYKKDRLIIVASNNQTAEFNFCNKTLSIEDYK